MKKKFLLVALVSLLVVGVAASAWFILRGGGVAKTHQKALASLPEETIAVASFDAEPILAEMSSQLETMLGFRLDDDETREKLGAYFETRVGIDPFKVRRIVFFAAENGAALLIHGDLVFDPEVGSTEDYEGHVLTRMGGGLWATPVAKALALGDKKMLRRLIDVERGEHKGLEGTVNGERHVALLEELGDGVVIATVALSDDMQKELADNLLEGAEIKSLGARFDFEAGTLLLEADAATRGALLKRLDSLKDDVRDGVAEARDNLEDLELPVAIGVILADRHIDELFEKISPKEDGDHLRLDLNAQTASLLYLAGVFVVQGIGARSYFGQAKEDATRAQIDNIANHLEMYLYEHDEYPSSLDVLTRKEKGRGKAILKAYQLRDPWKKTLRYDVRGDGFTLCSSGRDKQRETRDDICFGSDF